MNSARDRLLAAGGVAFKIEGTMTVSAEEGTQSIEIKYAGDFRPGYRTALLSVKDPSGTWESREVSSNLGFRGITHVLDPETGNWEVHKSATPYFIDLPALFGLDERALGQLTLHSESSVDGMALYFLRADLPDIEIAGAAGSARAHYLIGKEDELLRSVEVSGILYLEDEAKLFGRINGNSAAFEMVAELSGHGKHVPITTPELALPLFTHDAVSLDDGRVLVGSGFTGVANNDFIVPLPSVAVEVCEASNEECTLLEPPALPGVMYSFVKLDDGRVLSVGMGSQDGSFGNTNLFDPQTSTWTVLPSAPRDRALPYLLLLEDGRVLVVGGLDFSGSSSSSPDIFQEVDIFDPDTKMWSEAAPMKRAFVETDGGQLLITLNDGRIMAFGETADDFQLPIAHAEVYDPTSDSWSTVNSLDVLYPVIGGARLLDGTILVIGGAPLGEVEFISRDGRQLSAAEKQEKTEAKFPHAKVYDPVTDTWTSAGGMQYPRSGATATLLPDGRVLVAGGTARDSSPFERGENELIPFTEVYDSSTNTWSLGPEMQIPRTEHTATALPDGRVLIAGGIGVKSRSGERYPLASIEIIDPATGP